ncbi:MAG: ATP-binding protein [Defluviitaleaceae bacterium]|nr:ATP-binding protein [Defluviitaleaceae bacterium]
MHNEKKTTSWRYFFIFSSLGISVLLIISLSVLYLIVSSTMRGVIYDYTIGVAQLEKQLYASEIDAWFSSAYSTVNSLSNTLSALSTPQEYRGQGFRDFDERDREFRAIAENIVRENDYIINVFIGFSDGSIINGSGIVPGSNWLATGTRWYRDATEAGAGEIVITNPYWSQGNRNFTAAIAQYLPELNNVGAVVGVSVVQEDIMNRITYNRVLGGGYRVLTTNTGDIIYHSMFDSLDGDYSVQTLFDMPGGNYLLKSICAENRLSTFNDPVLGYSYLITAPLEVVDWTLFEIIPVSAVDVPVSQSLNTIIVPAMIGFVILAVFSLAMLFMTFVATRRTVRSANEIKAAIESENKMHEKVRLLHKTMPGAYVLLDEKYQVIECNRAAVDMFMLKSESDDYQELITSKTNWNPRCKQVCKGCPEESIDNCSGHRYFMQNYRYTYPDYETNKEEIEKAITAHAKMSVESMSQNSVYRYQHRYVTFFGEGVTCEVTVNPIDIHGAVNYAFYLRDIRSEKRREEAEQENRAKSRFLARMSHEIRTPINAVRGITEIQLQQERHSPDIEEAFLRIYNSSNLLLAIINDILDMARVEAGEMRIISEVYSTAGLIVDAIQLNLLHKKSKKIEFKMQVDENLPSFMIGDELRIKQIINNLLSNAFKYTQEGLVTISFGLARSQNNQLDFITVVTDTGQGLVPEQIDVMFENDYTRFNERENHRIEGTGLGTSIIYQLVKMMNGEITVESTPDIGSTFTVRIPQEQSGEDTLGKKAIEKLESLHFSKATLKRGVQLDRTQMNMPYGRVLVVDDVEANIYVAKGLLSLYKLIIDTAESGEEAIALVKSGKVYDIIFMDHMMPVMDGIEAVKILRDMGYNHPIVALTANAIKGAEDLFIKNGFDGFISKPIDLKQLNECLIHFIREKQSPDVLAAADAQTLENSHSNMQISGLYEAFARGSTKFVDAIESILKQNEWDENNIKNYTIYTHGLKGALMNIGRISLSEEAALLEQSGRNKDLTTINEKTPDFIVSLRELIKKLQPEKKHISDEQDVSNLSELLHIISDACKNYDISLADSTLDTLKSGACSKKTKETLENISELILRGAFEKAAEVALAAAK